MATNHILTPSSGQMTYSLFWQESRLTLAIHCYIVLARPKYYCSDFSQRTSAKISKVLSKYFSWTKFGRWDKQRSVYLHSFQHQLVYCILQWQHCFQRVRIHPVHILSPFYRTMIFTHLHTSCYWPRDRVCCPAFRRNRPAGPFIWFCYILGV